MDQLPAAATRLGEQGRTVLVSSHILAEVEQVADTIPIIGHGRLLASGTVVEVIGGSCRTTVKVTISWASPPVRRARSGVISPRKRPRCSGHGCRGRARGSGGTAASAHRGRGVAMGYIVLVEGVFGGFLTKLQPWLVKLNFDAWIQHDATYYVDNCQPTSDGGYGCSTITKTLTFEHGAWYLAIVTVVLVALGGFVFARRDIN